MTNDEWAAEDGDFPPSLPLITPLRHSSFPVSSFVIRHSSFRPIVIPQALFLAPNVHSLILSLVKILFIGDIVGEPGRRAVKTLVPLLRLQHRLDAVVANGENAAGGSGITPKTAEEISPLA